MKKGLYSTVSGIMTKCVLVNFAAIFMLLFFSCGGKQSEMEVDNSMRIYVDSLDIEGDFITHVECHYYNFDGIENLTLFFDSVANIHGLHYYDYNDDKETEIKVKKCIEQIDNYRKGKLKYFPNNLVQEILRTLGHDAADILNHSGEVNLVYNELFLMCSAFYSPDITCLVNMQSLDHNVGVLNF